MDDQSVTATQKRLAPIRTARVCFPIFFINNGAWGGVVVKALRY